MDPIRHVVYKGQRETNLSKPKATIYKKILLVAFSSVKENSENQYLERSPHKIFSYGPL